MAFLVKHKLVIAALGAGALWYWRTRPTTCNSPDSIVRDGKCYRTGVVEALFDTHDASDAPVAVDDNGNPLITRPSQL